MGNILKNLDIYFQTFDKIIFNTIVTNCKVKDYNCIIYGLELLRVSFKTSLPRDFFEVAKV